MSHTAKIAFFSGIMMLMTSIVAPSALAQNSGSGSQGSSNSGSSSGTVNLVDNNDTVCTSWQIQNGFCKNSFREVFRIIINFALGFLALVATGFLVYGGFLYLTAGASEDNVDKAKKIITYSAMGILLIFLAWAIVATMLSIGKATA